MCPEREHPVMLILVMPPQLGLLRGFSTGLVSLANYVTLHRPSLRVEILDLSSTPHTMVASAASEVLEDGFAPIVGISTTTASYQSALMVAGVFRELCANCTIVLGGHHASADAAVVLQSHPDLVDFVFIGESERSLLQFLEEFPDVGAVPGIAYRGKEQCHFNPPAPLLTTEELDLLPLTFDGRGLVGSPGKFHHVTYVSARGCPLSCAFCAVANERIRARSIDKVVEDVQTLVQMGYTQIAIEDNFFAHSPVRTQDLCHALTELRRKGFEFTWDCQTRVESMARPGIVPLLEEAGCEAVYLGVEALTENSLLYLRKTQNPNRYITLLCEKVVPALLTSSVGCYINLQFGIPGESWEEQEARLSILAGIGEAAARYGKVIWVFPQLHVVYPGTMHFAEHVHAGRMRTEVFEGFTAWEIEETPVRRWLGEHFAHGTGGIPYGILDPELLRQDQYRVDNAKVDEVNEALTAVARLPGIRVFKYGEHLVQSTNAHADCVRVGPEPV